jgi:Matrixin
MLAALAACSGADQPAYVPRDPCATLAIIASPATAVERDGITDALALWRERGVAAFDPATGVTSPAPAPDAAPDAIEVHFDDAASVFHGVYDPDTDRVIINRGITDRATIAIVVAHELGHVFGLSHITASTRVSLMNPGNLVTPPTDDDQRTLEARWGVCK